MRGNCKECFKEAEIIPTIVVEGMQLEGLCKRCFRAKEIELEREATYSRKLGRGYLPTPQTIAEIVAKRHVKPLRLSKVGGECAFCGKAAELFDHVIPKRVSKFFDAGWNLVPSCLACNRAKRDDIRIELIRTPGKLFYEDAAVWAVVYKLLDAPFEEKKRLMERARQDLLKWGELSGSLALEALEVYIKEHWCLLWQECQKSCFTGGQLVALMGGNQVRFYVPDGLKHLISGLAIA